MMPTIPCPKFTIEHNLLIDAPSLHMQVPGRLTQPNICYVIDGLLLDIHKPAAIDHVQKSALLCVYSRSFYYKSIRRLTTRATRHLWSSDQQSSRIGVLHILVQRASV